MSTKIEWCDLTINPVVGCSKCSPGCDNCYAERRAAILAKKPNPKISGKYAGVVDERGRWTGKTNFDHKAMKVPSTKRGFFANQPGASPKRIFVGSMCDLFHPTVSDRALNSIFYTIAQNPDHTFIFLTKRAAGMNIRMNAFASVAGGKLFPLPNLWLGVTVCNQAEADEKIPVLLRTPAAKRVVSVEPMLAALDFCHIPVACVAEGEYLDALRGVEYLGDGAFNVPKIDWIICGGETGPKARPMHPDWARSLRDQCVAAGTPFFFKGWGEWIKAEYEDFPDWQKRDGGRGIFTNLDPVRGQFWDADYAYRPDGQGGMQKIYGTDLMQRVGKRLSGRLLDGREWNEAPG